MDQVRLHRLVWVLVDSVLLMVVIAALASCIFILKGYRVYAHPVHQDAWIGAGDLLVVQQQKITPGMAVVIDQLNAGSAWGVGRVLSSDPASNRVTVVAAEGSVREIAAERVRGQVHGVLSGVGEWWQWISQPAHLVSGVVLPIISLILLEGQHLAKQCSRTRRFVVATKQTL